MFRMGSKRENHLGQLTRFGSPMKPGVFEVAVKGVVPTSCAKGVVPTRASTNWAVMTFKEWMEQRDTQVPDDPIPSDILELNEASVECRVMRLFVLEACCSDSQPCAPATPQLLVS